MHEEQIHLVFNCVKSFFLGIIQGATEFLPISSTAHLKVIPYLLGWRDLGVSFSASLQLGSSFAIIFYFRDDISQLVNSFFSILKYRQFFKDENTRLVTYIFIANLPILFLGLLIKIFWHDFSNSGLRSLFSIAIVSIVMSLFLALSELYSQKNKLFIDIKLSDIFLLGLSQSLAIFPGVSRSGITLTSALFSGIERQTAAKLSFLIGIPAISISGFVELFAIFRTSSTFDMLTIIIGIISSFFSSLIVIDLLLKFLKNNNTFIFVYYRLAFGIFILSIL